jgi:DNA-binding transcriptional ArsR family regulator
MKKDTKQVAVVAGVAVGLAALTAAGYFVFGPNGKNNRKQIKGWSLKMKGEILERLEKLKDVTPEVYNAIIDEVSAKYGKLKNISEEEVAAIATDLKKHWRAISRDLKEKENKGKKKVVQAKKVVKKVVKTAAKKVAKEATKVAETI